MNEIYNSILLYKQNEITIIPNEADYFAILTVLQNFTEFHLDLSAQISIKPINTNEDVLRLFKNRFRLAVLKTFLFENNDVDYYYTDYPDGTIQIFWSDKKYPYRSMNMAQIIDGLIKRSRLDVYLKLQYQENFPQLFKLSLSNVCKSSGLNILELFSSIVLHPQDNFQLKQIIDFKLQQSRLAVIQNTVTPSAPLSPIYSSSETSENEYNTMSAVRNLHTPTLNEMLSSAFIVYMDQALHITPAYKHCDKLFEELVKTQQFTVVNDDNRLIVSNLPEEQADLRSKFSAMFFQAKIYNELAGSDQVKYFYYGDPKVSIEVIYILITTDKRDIRGALTTILEDTGLDLYFLLKINEVNPLSFELSFKFPFNNHENTPSIPGLLKIIIENIPQRNALLAFLFKKYQEDRSISNIPDQSVNNNTHQPAPMIETNEENSHQNESARKRKRYDVNPYQIQLQYSELNEKTNLDKSVNLKQLHTYVYLNTDMVYKNGVRIDSQFLPSIEWDDKYHMKGKTNIKRQTGTLNGDKVYSITNWKAEYRLVYLTQDNSYPKVNLNDYYKLLEYKFNNKHFQFIDGKPVGYRGVIRKWKKTPNKKEQFFKALSELTHRYELVKPADYESRTSEDHPISNNNNQADRHQNPSNSAAPPIATPQYPNQSTLYHHSQHAQGPQHQPLGRQTIDLSRSD